MNIDRCSSPVIFCTNFFETNFFVLFWQGKFQAMGLLDELKGIVIDQQRAIRERDAKIGTLQESFNFIEHVLFVASSIELIVFENLLLKLFKATVRYVERKLLDSFATVAQLRPHLQVNLLDKRDLVVLLIRNLSDGLKSMSLDISFCASGEIWSTFIQFSIQRGAKAI